MLDLFQISKFGADWSNILLAVISDSVCICCRNDTYCVSGRIALHVYRSDSVDLNSLSYPWSATEGERVEFKCPSLSCFNKTDRQIEWFKVSNEPVTARQQIRCEFQSCSHLNPDSKEHMCSSTGLWLHSSSAGQRSPDDPCSEEVPRRSVHLPAHRAHQQAELQSQQSLPAARARLVTCRASVTGVPSKETS